VYVIIGAYIFDWPLDDLFIVSISSESCNNDALSEFFKRWRVAVADGDCGGSILRCTSATLNVTYLGSGERKIIRQLRHLSASLALEVQLL